MSSNEKESIWPIVIVACAVVCLWLLALLLLHDRPDRGTFGDMFGSVNALFSGFAFAGVLYAIFLQRRELKLQRLELEQTRAELRGQREQQIVQNETIRAQAFENTFFQLLRLQNEITSAIGVDKEGKVLEGRDCFQQFYENLRYRWNDLSEDREGLEQISQIDLVYNVFYPEYEAEIGHYFRSLYNLVKFVDQSSIEDKRLYTNLIRAQLSSWELGLLFYNCLSEYGRDHFKPLVRRYALLKSLPSFAILEPEHAGFYGPEAFA